MQRRLILTLVLAGLPVGHSAVLEISAGESLGEPVPGATSCRLAALRKDDGGAELNATCPVVSSETKAIRVQLTELAETMDAQVSASATAVGDQVSALETRLNEQVQNLTEALASAQAEIAVLKAAPGDMYNRLTIYASDGTFTPPSGVTEVYVVAVGGGGGGGGATRASYGGFAFGYANVSDGAPVAVTVGAGGGGGNNQHNPVGRSGGSSRFGDDVVAGGGSGVNHGQDRQNHGRCSKGLCTGFWANVGMGSNQNPSTNHPPKLNYIDVLRAVPFSPTGTAAPPHEPKAWRTILSQWNYDMCGWTAVCKNCGSCGSCDWAAERQPSAYDPTNPDIMPGACGYPAKCNVGLIGSEQGTAGGGGAVFVFHQQ